MSILIETDDCKYCEALGDNNWCWELQRKINYAVVPDDCPLPKAKKKMTIVKVPEKYHGLSGKAGEAINKKYNCTINENGIFYSCYSDSCVEAKLHIRDNFCHSCGSKINWVEERV